jgi:hypothetical protein
VHEQLPRACVVAPLGRADCVKATLIEPGTFTFSAMAGKTLSCSADTPCSFCADTHVGGCRTSGSIEGTILTASSSVVLDDRYGVYPRGEGAGGAGVEAGAPGSLRVRIELRE